MVEIPRANRGTLTAITTHMEAIHELHQNPQGFYFVRLICGTKTVETGHYGTRPLALHHGRKLYRRLDWTIIERRDFTC